MSVITEYDVEQGSEDWRDLRRGLLTASVMGKLVTPKTLKTATNDEARGLIALIVAERITGWSEPTYTNADMQRGHDVEPIAREWYVESRRTPVSELGLMVREFGSFRIGYSPDGLVGDDGLIEIKAPRAKGHLSNHVNGVPLGHMAQMQTGMLVADRQWCDFISYCGGMPPLVVRVPRDERWIEAIKEAAAAFEVSAAALAGEYAAATEGLPTTDRLPAYAELGLVI